MSGQTDSAGRTTPWPDGFPKAVIFDMDGLMYGTEQQILRAWNTVGPEITGEPMGYHLQNTMGMNRSGRVKYFRDAYGGDFSYEKFENAYRAEVGRMKRTEGIPVQKGLFALLAFLTDRRIPLVLATGSSGVHTYENLALTRTPNVFAVIITGDMVREAKPDPYIYRLACSRIGKKPEEVLVLEDSVNGVRAAFAAGTPVIMVPDLVRDTSAVEGMYFAKMNSLLDVRKYLQDLEPHQ